MADPRQALTDVARAYNAERPEEERWSNERVNDAVASALALLVDDDHPVRLRRGAEAEQ